MEEEDNIIVRWVQKDVETSYNLLNKIKISLSYEGRSNVCFTLLSNSSIFSLASFRNDYAGSNISIFVSGSFTSVCCLADGARNDVTGHS